MPVLGTGIIPSGSIGNELTYVTRRAFVPKLTVQIYNSSPLAAALISNAQMASGGISSVTVPVQGTPFVTPQWSDYSGSFNQPTVQQGAYNGEFNLKLLITPVPFLGMEGAVQMDFAVIPLIEARMNDAGNGMTDVISTALYNNYSNVNQIIGLPGAIDDGTNLVTYGNLSRTTNTWWKGKVYTVSPTANPTRNNVMQYISGTFKNGAEMPTFGVMGVGTWALLSQDIIGSESYQITPGNAFSTQPNGAQAAFTALSVGGVPIYADPYCPEGLLYFVNTRYLSLYIHKNAAFAFTGFVSTIPNYQLGYVGAVVAIMEMVVAKPKAMTRVTGFNSLTI